MLCQIYRSSKRTEMYLYTDLERGLDAVPEELLARFGKPESVMKLNLTADRKLARVDSAKVLQSLQDQGYYLQMPPSVDGQMAEIGKLNEKLPRA